MRTKDRLFLMLPIGLGLVLFAFQNCAGNNFAPVSGDGVLASSISDPRAGTGEISANGSETNGGASGGGGSNGNTGPESSGGGSGSNGSGSSGNGSNGNNGGLPSNPAPEGTVTPPGSSAGGNTPPRETVCTITNTHTTKSIKVLFVVDVSGSNLPTTDPNKSFRYNAVKKFLDQFRNRTNFQWQFITFGGTFAKSYLKSSVNGKPNFTSSPSEMDRVLGEFMKSSDQNAGTPYLKAFNEIAANIDNDPDRTKVGDPANYVVVFLSDGLPTDLNHYNFYGTNWESNAVQLLNLSPGRLTLTAVYYGERSQTAGKNMSDMATRLGGQFIDTNVAGYNFSLTDAVNLPELVCR